ncbi:OmpA family protein [uncultured Planktosalinus sp.]|uniref:OmpA family protein n=1 Tax=uncultured Planktosalinus sp. TaxID=1810935 RepID=UPI0030D8D3D6
MKINTKIVLILVIFFSTAGLIAQKAQIKKADRAYDQYSYIDAQKIYLKVVEEGYTSAEIYKKLGNTYYFNSEYSNAAKWYEKLIIEFPEETEPEYYFRASQSLKSKGDYEKADEFMNAFAESGGSQQIIQDYKNNKDYLNSILSLEDKYVFEKTEINSEYSDFGPSFYNGKLVFASASGLGVVKPKIHDWNAQPFLNLYVADKNEDGKLSGATLLSEDINTKFHESTAVFAKDGKTIYFTRNNYIDGKKKKDKDNLIRLKIYRATMLAENTWTNIEELPFNDDSYSVAHPALSVDGKKLYFSSDMPGTTGQSDLWYVDILDNGSFGNPVNLGVSINTEARESFPFISDENVLYFSTDGRAGLGGFDVFYTELNEQGLPTKINPLGTPVNSSKDDFGFILDTNSNIGFISSNRSGDSGSKDDDIYRINRICEITISGLVTDEDTGELLPGSLVTLMDEGNEVISTTTVGSNAKYTFKANCDKKYIIRGTKENYNPTEKVINTPENSSSIDVPLMLKSSDPCPPNDLGCRLTLQPIYFDFDRYNIRPDAAVELAKILAAMKEYPELIIHIESHTDSRGSDVYNELLSERRAQSTLEWLVSKGIDRDRLSARGYGESRLINECSNGVACSEEKHQLNRRSMFIIQN